MTTHDFLWAKQAITYDFLSAKQAILSNVRTDFNLTNFSFGQLLTELAHIMTTYDFLWAKQAILSNVRTDFSLTQFRFWSTFDMNWHK